LCLKYSYQKLSKSDNNTVENVEDVFQTPFSLICEHFQKN